MAYPPQLQEPPASSPSPRRSGGGEWLIDLITVIFLIASVILLSGTVLIISNPDVSFNPFPLAALPTQFQTPTPTITFTPSITPTPTETPLPPTPTATSTAPPTATSTVTPSITPTSVLPGIESVPTVTLIATLDIGEGGSTPDPNDGSIPLDPLSPFPFVARTVRYEANTNDQGCQWLSIAGNITGLGGEPVLDLAVEVSGVDFQFVEFSGSAPAFGESGFEVPIASSPGRDEYAVRLVGPVGIPISDYVNVTTGSACDTNVAVVEFVQVRDQ